MSELSRVTCDLSHGPGPWEQVSQLWRERVTAIGAEEYPDVELSHMYVDNAAMQLIRNPKQVSLCLHTHTICTSILATCTMPCVRYVYYAVHCYLVQYYTEWYSTVLCEYGVGCTSLHCSVL